MSTELAFGQIVIDATDPNRLAGFYSELLDRPIAADSNPYMARITGNEGFPGMMFLAVPEPRTGKNRLHVDLLSDDHQAAAERALGLGATKVGEFDEYGMSWITLADPEGNVFDIGRH